MSYYKRKLPHWQPAGAEFFITLRLKGSLPQTAIDRLKAFQRQFPQNPEGSEEMANQIQRKIFEKYEHLLDAGNSGPKWLKKKIIAGVVESSIHYRDAKLFELYAYCVMPNHIHLVFKHLIQED